MDSANFQNIFAHLPLPAFIFQDGCLKLINKGLEEVSGYSSAELLDMPIEQLIHPDDRDWVMEKAGRCLAGKDVYGSYVFRALSRSSVVYYVKVYFSVIEFNGHPAILGQFIDVTKQKILEETLHKNIANGKQSEEILRTALVQLKDLIEFLPDPTFAIDRDRKVIAWNKAMEQISGVPKDEIIGCGDYAYALPFYGVRRPTMVDMVFSRDMEIEKEYKYVEKKGDVLFSETFAPLAYGGKGAYIWTKASPLYDNQGNLVGSIDISRDITERKMMEEEIILQKAYFQKLFENAPMGIAMLDNRDQVLKINKGFENLFQYSLEEIKGRDVKEIIVPQNLSGESLDILNTALEGRVVGRETVRRRKGGGLINVALFSYPIEVNDKLMGIYAIYIDITKRKQAEELFRTMADSSPIGIYIIQDGVFRFINPRFQEHTGFTAVELLGRSSMSLIHPEDRIKVRNGAAKMLRGETFTPHEFRIINKHREVRWIMETLTSISYRGRRAALGNYMDITEHKQTEEWLRYLSFHDSLTGLYNRNYFEQEMRRMESGRFNPVGIIICDLDGLKFVNDTLGHDAGDGLLVAAAGVVKESFRNDDMVARIGGDEFAVLLPRCNLEIVENACRRVKEALSRYNEVNLELPMSLSLGFALSGETEPDMVALFREADNNMYREKLRCQQSARSAIVQTLMKAVEARDFIAEGHAERLQTLVAEMARVLGLSNHRTNDLLLLAQFHDIGKVGIPDHILFKQGPLTSDETNEMQRHCEIGHRIAQSSPDLAPIADRILKHHEWWDGGGYPLGLKGEDIPLECRILSIADAYDAMTNSRPYRDILTPEKAKEELVRCAGSQFDPYLVEVFLGVLDGQLDVLPK